MASTQHTEGVYVPRVGVKGGHPDTAPARVAQHCAAPAVRGIRAYAEQRQRALRLVVASLVV